MIALWIGVGVVLVVVGVILLWIAKEIAGGGHW